MNARFPAAQGILTCSATHCSFPQPAAGCCLLSWAGPAVFVATLWDIPGNCWGLKHPRMSTTGKYMSMQQELRGRVSIIFQSIISFPDLFISHEVSQTFPHEVCHLMSQAEDRPRCGIPVVKYSPPAPAVKKAHFSQDWVWYCNSSSTLQTHPTNQYFSKVHPQRQGYPTVKITAILCHFASGLNKRSTPTNTNFVCSLA